MVHRTYGKQGTLSFSFMEIWGYDTKIKSYTTTYFSNVGDTGTTKTTVNGNTNFQFQMISNTEFFNSSICNPDSQFPIPESTFCLHPSDPEFAAVPTGPLHNTSSSDH